MKKIDYKNWNRKEIFDFFSTLSNPFYVICFNVNVTKVYNFAKNNNISFYYSMIYLVNKAINSIENFRYSIKDGDIYLLDKREPSFTVLNKDTELFKIITMSDSSDDLITFCKQAKEKAENQDFFIDFSSESDNLAYYTCVPWLDMTSLTNERDLLNPKAIDDSIPRIAWGKFNNNKILNISIEVNHRFIDGIHIGKFCQQLEKEIDELGD